MVVTHLACVADRIDRSFSPCGGREERELSHLSKKRWKEKQLPAVIIAPAARPLISMHG
jgi:hypothetical protein